MFWLILCRKGRYCTVFARKFNQTPDRAGTCGDGMVINFIGGNVTRTSFLWVTLFGTRALCTQNYCLHRTCATGLFESGIVGATAEALTDLIPCSDSSETTDWLAVTSVVLVASLELLLAADTLLVDQFKLLSW